MLRSNKQRIAKLFLLAFFVFIFSLIIQNANAYLEGLGPDVQKMKQLIDAGDFAGINAAIDYMLSLQGIKDEYLHGAESIEKISPDAWLSDHYYLERAGMKEIQKTLFNNYPSNFIEYDKWQNYLKTYQPSALILWGKNDKIFTVPGAKAYTRDLKDSELHIFNGGHFALEEHYIVVSNLIDAFLKRRLNK